MKTKVNSSGFFLRLAQGRGRCAAQGSQGRGRFATSGSQGRSRSATLGSQDYNKAAVGVEKKYAAYICATGEIF